MTAFRKHNYCTYLFRNGRKLLAKNDSEFGKFSQSEAMQSLRILIEIAKNDGARHRSSLYEPFLTKIVEEGLVNPVISIVSNLRLLS